ncbi:GNAT family N-acetyltransferase [Chitinivibrio alkaliphilus]|uniref:N-acyltransferase superfamily protein n=1 Tax=Chitinivibrio alkaliphilus ACht1 TaxID=1313304 RepID=U7D8R3_9BACT|nr:GNAT family N-acetyltransferase [Chitinivibrio alkaliphilus]ERP31966.1 N-acyltransferase superfamily protein [Chitinivibrio alkaliphilus ACht1]
MVYEIVPVKKEELHSVAQLLAEVFSGEAITSQLFDFSREDTKDRFARMTHLRGAYYLRAGHLLLSVFHQGTPLGVAIVKRTGNAISVRERLFRWYGPLLRGMFSLVPVMRLRTYLSLWPHFLHPRHLTKPYWYLEALAVDPSWQGKGVGSALLEDIRERMHSDASVSGIFLETGTEENSALYEKRGYICIEKKGTARVPVYRHFLVNPSFRPEG